MYNMLGVRLSQFISCSN